jgi:hypothetical protein
MTGPHEAVSSVANSAIGAMKSTPMALALVIVNIIFLVFATYVLSEVSSRSKDRDKTQSELITSLVRDCARKQ